MERKLQIVFKDGENNRAMVSLANPKENLTTTDIKALGDKVIGAEILMTKTGVVNSLYSATEITTEKREILKAE